jgi:hypothetical protein
VKVFISRDGIQLGTWTNSEVRRYFQTGNLIGTDHYWHEGMAEWGTLDHFIAQPAPPAPELPVTEKPGAPKTAIEPPAEKSRYAWIAWVIPVVLAFAFALFVEPISPVSGVAERAGEVVGGLLLILIFALPVSLLFRRSWRLAIRCGIVVVIGLVMLGEKVQHQSTQRWMTEVQKFGQDQAKDEQQQIAKNGYATVDTQKINTEIKKLHDMSQGESSKDKKLTDFVIEKMKDVATRGQACQAAEKPMLELGLNPSKLTSLDELEKRRAAVQAPQPIVENFIAYLTNLDTTSHAELIAEGVSSATADGFVKGMDESGKMQALLAYWKQEDAILGDLLANLDILKKYWGQWQPQGNEVLFKDNSALAEYQANVAKLHADIELQKTAQAKVLNAGAPPTSP